MCQRVNRGNNSFEIKMNTSKHLPINSRNMKKMPLVDKIQASIIN